MRNGVSLTPVVLLNERRDECSHSYVQDYDSTLG